MATSGYRGQGVSLPSEGAKIGLPPRPFLYTLDQISVLIDVSLTPLKQQWIFFEGRSIGTKHKHFMVARNIAPPDEKPEWRVAERELVRWLKVKGFKYYERGTAY